MYGMNEMHEDGEDSDTQAKLQCLQEIKDLMDSRLGDKMNPNKGVAIEKVTMMDGKEDPEEEKMESPEMEAKEESGEMGPGYGDDDVGMNEKEKLKMMLMRHLGG